MKRHTLLLLSALLLALLAGPSHAHAAPLLTGLGGPAGFGTGNLPGNDDGSSEEINVRMAFPDGLHFFGSTFFALFVNNNGNVSFGGSNGTFTPEAFPVASLRMIAPWWGDVDTRGGGTPSRNGVYWSITPGRFVATWHTVGYYSTHDDLSNDFQLILTAAGPGIGDFDVEFRYNRCQWTTGDASGGSNGFGGTPAQAGFDAGNLEDFVVLPGSRTMAVLQLCTTSNVSIPGVWRFEIRGGEVMCPGRGDPCTTDLLGICRAGTRRCRTPDASVCVANVMPSAETCDNEDDDCDGRLDEDLGETMCGVGPCQVTTPNCVMGTPQTCVPRAPMAETCNRIDDDCDGEIDDLPVISCGIGVCQATSIACIMGVPQTCTPLSPSPEICNGFDDDCNGIPDDTLDACFARPDAGPPDAGGRDGGVFDVGPDFDGGPFFDAGVPDAPRCIGYGCNPYRLEGRAGPIGCDCRAGARRSPGLALGVLPLLALLLIRRRTR